MRKLVVHLTKTMFLQEKSWFFISIDARIGKKLHIYLPLAAIMAFILYERRKLRCTKLYALIKAKSNDWFRLWKETIWKFREIGKGAEKKSSMRSNKLREYVKLNVRRACKMTIHFQIVKNANNLWRISKWTNTQNWQNI